jgi:hypothetical protein
VRIRRHEAPRLARQLSAFALVFVLLCPPAALAGDEPASTGYNAVTGLGSTLCTLVYTPLKIVYAAGGSLVSGLAWMWTLGDKEIAGPILYTSVRGDYVVTPGNLEGRDELHFVGPYY